MKLGTTLILRIPPSITSTVSIIQMNAIKHLSHYSNMKDYLRQFTMFNVIVVSQTCSKEKEADANLEDYELFSV